EPRVLRERAEQVIEEPDARGQLRVALPVEAELRVDLGLAGLAIDLGASAAHLAISSAASRRAAHSLSKSRASPGHVMRTASARCFLPGTARIPMPRRATASRSAMGSGQRANTKFACDGTGRYPISCSTE